jgi:hypothetical protein
LLDGLEASRLCPALHTALDPAAVAVCRFAQVAALRPHITLAVATLAPRVLVPGATEFCATVGGEVKAVVLVGVPGRRLLVDAAHERPDFNAAHASFSQAVSELLLLPCALAPGGQPHRVAVEEILAYMTADNIEFILRMPRHD